VTTAGVTIDVRPTSGGTFTTVAQVSASEADPRSANNSVSQSISVVTPPPPPAPSADLALSAAPVPQSVDVGAAVRYRLSVTSGGPSNATAVQLVDTLPANASVLAAASTQAAAPHLRRA
jgi:uncharacterized repeat protein (TIGR01451 family)